MDIRLHACSPDLLIYYHSKTKILFQNTLKQKISKKTQLYTPFNSNITFSITRGCETDVNIFDKLPLIYTYKVTQNNDQMQPSLNFSIDFFRNCIMQQRVHICLINMRICVGVNF